MISAWVRVIRVRFLLASVIAVFVGLAASWWFGTKLDPLDAILTMTGVLALHVSVDLLNEYWDFKRGIDTNTKRTKMSGGTGVLPEGLLQPTEVYKVGVAFLILGTIIGAYFVAVYGIIIAAILVFAVVSIYFYSTKIVDSGLAELFVTIKGTMIVLGTFFIQVSEITLLPILSGIFVGILSSLVLFVTSYPDYDADKSKGRRTLVIVVGKKKGTIVFWSFPVIAYALVTGGVYLTILPIFSLIALIPIPLILMAGRDLKNHYLDDKKIISVMTKTLSFSRISGALLVISFLIPSLI